MVTKKHSTKSKKQLLVEALCLRAKKCYAAGEYQQALTACLQATQIMPTLRDAWIDAAINCIKLTHWQEAITYGKRALSLGADSFTLYDAFSHAYGALKQWDAVRQYGLLALSRRDVLFSRQNAANELPLFPENPWQAGDVPRVKNIIAFSLFGDSSKYCETAIINAQEQPKIYPGWVCRYYVDDSVPLYIQQRLSAAGGEVVQVADDVKSWPGTLWRFLALDDEQAYHVIFRDADSVISMREYEAVNKWINSDRLFHAMRDCPTHTELLLAGLWGATAGILPLIKPMIQHYLSKPVRSRHFADQYFLREYIWPRVRGNLLQHDSMFGFLDAFPFPGGPMPDNFHVGYAEGSVKFSVNTELPEGTAVTWKLVTRTNTPATKCHELCRYPARAKAGKVRAFLPARYADLLEQKKADIVIVA